MHEIFGAVNYLSVYQTSATAWPAWLRINPAKSMVAAMEAVETNKMSVTAAATFDVPRKTLDDRVKGRVKHGTKPGPNTVLTLEEENALMSYLVYMANCGFPLTRTMVKAFAWAIAKRLGNDGRFN